MCDRVGSTTPAAEDDDANVIYLIYIPLLCATAQAARRREESHGAGGHIATVWCSPPQSSPTDETDS